MRLSLKDRRGEMPQDVAIKFSKRKARERSSFLGTLAPLGW